MPLYNQAESRGAEVAFRRVLSNSSKAGDLKKLGADAVSGLRDRRQQLSREAETARGYPAGMTVRSNPPHTLQWRLREIDSRRAWRLRASPTCRRNDPASIKCLAFLPNSRAFEPSLFERKSPLPGNGIFRAETKRPKRLPRFRDAGAETKSR